MTKIVLATILVMVASAALAEKYPADLDRAGALRLCNASAAERWHRGTASDYESNRHADYSACMHRRGQVD
jgi:hypothetical protein